MLQNQPFDLVVTDMIMPDQDGCDVRSRRTCSSPSRSARVRATFSTRWKPRAGSFEMQNEPAYLFFHDGCALNFSSRMLKRHINRAISDSQTKRP